MGGSPHLVILVVDHLRDEGPGLGAPGLGAGLAGGGPVSRSARVLGVAAQQLQHDTGQTLSGQRRQLHLFESLLILPVLEGVDERVDGGGHPGQD